MATPADQRLLELLNTWLKSLELHTRYSSLDDDSYWKIQAWVEHQRPTRWIIDLAKQKTIALRSHLEERIKTGDTTYADSLELMIFLANLVGSEHIERFIPAAEAQNERSLKPSDEAPTPEEAGSATSDTGKRPAAEPTSATATREMPKFLAARRAPPPAGSAQVARTERKAAAPAKNAPKPAARPARPAPKPASKTSAKAATTDAACEQVIADAARLVQWGRKWYELPELIARMAGRPTLPDVRRILKENKAAIDAKAGGA